MASVISLIQSACYEANIPPPATFINNTDAFATQLLNLFYATGRELRQKEWWPQLKKQWNIILQPGQRSYLLPADYYQSLIATFWDQQNKWQMLGPLTDEEWNYRVYGYVTTENRKAYRVFGPDSNPNSNGGQFLIDPIPNSTNIGSNITFEYISKSWLTPAFWAPSTGYTTGTSYVINRGNIYKASGSSGTSSSTAIGPTMYNGIGQNGGAFFQYYATTAWAGTTLYALGQYVTNGGSYYLCIQPGTSASSGGPTGTSQSITDGTVIWQNIVPVAWTGETAVGNGSYITANSNLYFCTSVAAPNSLGLTTSITGKLAPNFTSTTEVDGTATWTWQNIVYDTALADSDLCLFDDNIMIAGLKWRFMQARGLQYEDQLELYTEMISTAQARWNPGKRIRLGEDTGVLNAGLNPTIREGSFG